MRVPLEMLSLLGAKSVVLTSAAGSVRNDINPGTLVTITDHINLTGLNPLIGESGRERFVDMSGAYDRHLQERFAIASGQLGRKVHEAVYMWLPGPSFETAAEIRAAQALGAQVVGMAIVPETMLARRFGLRVLALGHGDQSRRRPAHRSADEGNPDARRRRGRGFDGARAHQILRNLDGREPDAALSISAKSL